VKYYYTNVRVTCAWLSALGILTGSALAMQDAPAEAGRKIYVREKCSVCHQIAGQGNQRFPLDGVGARLPAADLRRWFTHTREMEAARPKIPAIKMSSRKYRLSDAELDALVAYLLTLK